MIAAGEQGFSFNEVSIGQNAPTASGVYALYTAQQWIYVGESQNIRDRLLQHLRGDTPDVTRRIPTAFVFELQPERSRVARQDELILAYGPIANKKLG